MQAKKERVCALRRVVAIIFDLWLVGKGKEREVSQLNFLQKS